MSDLILSNDSFKIGEYTIYIKEFRVKSPKRFSEIFLWDNKGNCRSLNVEHFMENQLDNSFTQTFSPTIFEVASNIEDRKYVIEFLQPGEYQDIYQLGEERFNLIKKHFRSKKDLQYQEMREEFEFSEKNNQEL